MFSLDARGKFAGALVFSNLKGRPVVRQLVVPANPQSSDQQVARNRVRVYGAIQHFINATALLGDGRTSMDKDLLIAAAPAGQAWNGNLVKQGIGAGGITYDAAETSWAALAANHAAWDTAADALVPPIAACNQVDADGIAGTPLTSGNVFFHMQYALFILGIGDAPGAVPQVYAP